jgi:hypothetical protein
MKDILLAVPDAHKAWLEAKSRELGISQTEIIRRMIESAMGISLQSPYAISLAQAEAAKGKPS